MNAPAQDMKPPNMPASGFTALPEPEAPASPFPHLVEIKNFPEHTTTQELQKFFLPNKAIALNQINSTYCQVAFKTHQEAESAMGKNATTLNGQTVSLRLISKAPSGFQKLETF